jgi:hypothetical protein
MLKIFSMCAALVCVSRAQSDQPNSGPKQHRISRCFVTSYRHGGSPLVLGAALVGLAWLPSASATAAVASYPAGLATALPQGQVEQAHWRRWRHCHRYGRCHGGVYGGYRYGPGLYGGYRYGYGPGWYGGYGRGLYGYRRGPYWGW